MTEIWGGDWMTGRGLVSRDWVRQGDPGSVVTG